MKKKWTRFLLVGIAMVSLVLSACGGGGSSGGDTGETTDPVYMTGQFIDSAVSGLIYRCSSGDSGITTSEGEFTCQEGNTVEFFVGDYSIGSATAKKYITPYDLGDDDAAFNVAQLLLTLDSDDNPLNGITIPEVLPASLGTITTRPGDLGFESAMATALGEALIDATVAQNHLESSYGDLLSTWDYHFDIGKPFYNIFFEDNVWKIVTVELTSESAVKATFEGTTYNGTWAVIDDEVYGEILNIAVSGQDPGYYRLLVVEENRLNVCYADSLNEMDVCDDSEYFYFDLADAQAHGSGDSGGSDDTNTGGGDDTNTGGGDDTNTGGDLFLDHLAISVPFYNVFFEDNQWQVITFELTSDTTAQATFEGVTYTGTWEILDNDILTITVSGQDPGYHKLIAVEENRLNVCYSDTLAGIESCTNEYFYFNLTDAQAHN